MKTSTPIHRLSRWIALQDAGRRGEDSALAGQPYDQFAFEDEDEQEAYTEGYQRIVALLAVQQRDLAQGEQINEQIDAANELPWYSRLAEWLAVGAAWVCGVRH